MRRALVLLLTVLASGSCFGAGTNLPTAAAKLFARAQSGKHYAEAVKLAPEIVPTSDGRSFVVVWKPSAAPKRWVVSLHGTQGFATDDLAIWHPHVKGRDVGMVCVQWWLGEETYYPPVQIHREIELILKKLSVPTNSVMLHGFSRGSANSYAVAALDAGRGSHYFSLNVASSGGVGLDYPPTRAIGGGEYGRAPLRGSRWITVAGARDPNPDRDGITGMRRAGTWLKEQGAVVLMAIEDPKEGHGALVRNPANARRVLDLFLKEVGRE